MRWSVNHSDVPHLQSQVIVASFNRQQRRKGFTLVSLGLGARLSDGRTVLRARASRDILVVTSASSDQVGVVNRRVHGHRGRGADVLIAVLVNHVLKLVRLVANLVQENVVVHRAGRSLQSDVGIQKEIPVMGAGDLPLHECTRQRIAIAISAVPVIGIRESTQVVTLIRNHDAHLAFEQDSVADLRDDEFDHLRLLEHCGVFRLRDTVTEVVQALRSLSSSNNIEPLADERLKNEVDVGLADDLNTIPVRLTTTHVTTGEGICGNSHGGQGGGPDTRMWVRDVCSNDHGLRPKSRARNAGDGPRRGSPEFGIDFHQDIGVVLGAVGGDVDGLETLRRNTKAAVTRLLDPLVRVHVLARENEHEQLRLLLVPLCLGLLVQLLHRMTNVFSQLNDVRPVDNFTAVLRVDLHELIQEAQRLVVGDGTALAGKESNSPTLERLSVRFEEFLASKIPTSSGSRVVLLVVPKLDLRVRQKASFDLHHLAADRHPVLLENGIFVMTKLRLELLDVLQALRGPSRGEFDHVRYLGIQKLVAIFLKALHNQKLRRVHDILFGHFHQRHIWEFEVDVVLLQEVLLDAHPFADTGGWVLDVNHELPGQSDDHSLDDEALVFKWAALVVGTNPETLDSGVESYHGLRCPPSAVTVRLKLQNGHQLLVITHPVHLAHDAHERNLTVKHRMGNIHVENQTSLEAS